MISQQPFNRTLFVTGAGLGSALLFLSACAKHLEFPPLGEPLSSSATLEVSKSLKDLTIRYSDSCGQIQDIPLGDRLHEAMREGVQRTFKTVLPEDDAETPSPDHLIQVDLVDSAFDLNKEALYDRPPASLQLTTVARVYDRTGTLLRQSDITVARRERLRLEQLGKNCNYHIDPFIQDTAIEVATRVALIARVAAGGQGSLGSSEPNSAPSDTLPVPSASTTVENQHPPTSTLSALRFKAMLLDENSDLMFEGGEHVRIRVDIVNTGTTSIENAWASLAGTSAIIDQFPTTTLKVPSLLPGQTKSLEFLASLPLLAEPLHAEIRVAVEERGGAAARTHALSFTITPTGSSRDDIDQVPAQASGARRPETSVISIGLSSYLNQRIQSRKYASQDAETVAKYFQTLGGVPSSNISLLTDRKATYSQIEKALREWLPTRSTKDGIVIVYFSGHAMVSPLGEIMLVPYDGAKAATTLYRLKSLESVFATLNPRQAILVFEGKISQLQDHPKTTVTPQWDLHGDKAIRLIAVEGLGKGLDDDGHHHGLFTYYLLRGLRGEADTNHDGKVTLGEIGGFVRQKVTWASKSKFGSVQRPQIIPLLKPDDKAADVVLTTLPSLAASETP
ncbi:MAG: caspase family protein [Nitrospira sp.]|nr:caspase family protein [Nitrospira sp.]MDH4371182.1 caspase family protein [Nitrospira sp.]MDH5348328.1 caspase family protein [Nitrospira sp.]MDH5497234.1 caspase family protein [Nitrospira sp.]MDH5723922.1 caspase family protein [Nitrospira sp.]